MGYNSGCHAEDWFKWLSVTVALAVVATLIASFIVFGDSRAVTNYSIFASKDDVPSNMPADADGFVRGQLYMNQNQKHVKWDLLYDRLTAITALYVMGPIGQTSSETGPIALPLCGSPSSLACDLSVPHKVTGEITHQSPGNQSLRDVITKIREAPAFYKLCAATMSGEFVCSNLIPG